MGQPETSVAALCKELEVTRQTLYRHISPTGELREDGRKLLTGSCFLGRSRVCCGLSRGPLEMSLYKRYSCGKVKKGTKCSLLAL